MPVNTALIRDAGVSLAPEGAPQPETPYRGTCGSGRMRKMACWLFLLPVFSEGVFPGVVKVETAGIAMLAFASVVIRQDGLAVRAFLRVYAVLAVLTLVVLGYIAFGSRPTEGAASAYLEREMMLVITYTLVALFAVVFFSLREFEQVLWRIASIALPVAVVTCAVSRLTGQLILVNPDAGGLRMMGTLTEPSEWAPILAAVLLLALRRRSPVRVILALAGLFLADSPTCILVMVVSVCLYALITYRWRGRAAVLIALAVCAPFAVAAYRDAPALLESGNPAVVAVGRLASGVQNAETDGEAGQNTRYASVLDVTTAAREGGWTMSGAGPAADAVYFTAVHAEGGPVQAANAMWLSVLFDLGEWGLAVFAVMLLAGLRGMRRDPLALAVFLPFFTAAMVNSTIPDWSMTALGILLFAFGWASRPYAAAPSTSRRPAASSGRRLPQTR